MGKKTAKADLLQQKSPAEFFAENKNIAGFDNVSSLFEVDTVKWHRPS